MSTRTPLPTVNERDTENVSMNSIEVHWNFFVFHSLQSFGCKFISTFKLQGGRTRVAYVDDDTISGVVHVFPTVVTFSHVRDLMVLHRFIGK